MAAVFPMHSTSPDLTLISRVKAYLRDLETPTEQFCDALNSLDEGELNSFGYGYFYFNLLSVFAGKLGLEEIRRLAVECIKNKLRSGWESCRYMVHAKRQSKLLSPSLKNWDTGMLKNLLSCGRGMIICTSHFGPFRHITTDLLIMGYKLCVGLDSESSMQMKGLGVLLDGSCEESSRRSAVQADFTFGDGRFRVVDVERNQLATAILLASLKRNEIVVLYMDGNTGLDGPRGDSNRIPVSFLGHPCLVKTGIARLAVLSGSPLIHIVAVNQLDGPHLALQHPFEIRTSGAQQERQQRVEELTSEFYRQMERQILQYPSQWESSCLLHRWRVRQVAPPLPPANRAQVLRLLEQSGTVRLKKERVAKVETDRGQILIDVDNLRTFAIGAHLHSILQKLYDSELSYDCLHQEADKQRSDIDALLCKFHSLQWIVSGPAPESMAQQVSLNAS